MIVVTDLKSPSRLILDGVHASLFSGHRIEILWTDLKTWRAVLAKAELLYHLDYLKKGYLVDHEALGIHPPKP
jgi:hypothetical protein